MRVFLAGASGVLGRQLVPLLVAAGHDVAAMTRSPQKTESLRALGAQPVVCDVYDAEALRRAVAGFRPEVVVNELTDLPDDRARLPEARARNARMRREGNNNLLAAAGAAGARRYVAQSIAWEVAGESAAAVEELERSVLAAGGVVVRYGQFFGPGTFFEDELPDAPRIHVDEAARRTVGALEADSGVVVITGS